MTLTPDTTTPGPLAARPVKVTVSLDLGDDAFGAVSIDRADPQWIRSALDEYTYSTVALVEGFADVAFIDVTACHGHGRPAVVSVLPVDHAGRDLDPAYAAACRRLQDELRDLIGGWSYNWIAAMQAADTRYGIQPLD